MRLKRSALAVALTGACAAFPAFAGSGAASSFNSMDKDGNGYVSQQEWNDANRSASAGGSAQSSSVQSSQGAQASGSGQAPDAGLVVITLTPVQTERMQRQQRESMFRELDSDSDGIISLSEAGVNTQLLQAFAQLDRDGNGRIERREFASVHMNDGSSSSQASASGSGSASTGGTASQQPQSQGGQSQSQSAGSGQ